MEASKRSFSDLALGLGILAGILAVWEAFGRLGTLSPLVVPLPSRIGESTFSQLIQRNFWLHWLSTLTLWGASLCMGLMTGLFLGFLAGISKRIYAVLFPVLSFLRAIPPIVLFPVALVALGAGDLPILVVATASCALYVFPVAADSAQRAQVNYRDLASLLGVSGPRFIRYFVFPSTAYTLGSIFRITSTLSLTVCIAGEVLVGGRTGVGSAIVDYSERYQLAEAYAYVAYVGVVGLVIDFTSVVVFKRYFAFRHAMSEVN